MEKHPIIQFQNNIRQDNLYFFYCLYHAALFHTDIASIAKDNMIENGNPQNIAGIHQPQGHIDIRPAGLWIAAGVGCGQGARSTVDGVRKDNEAQNIGWLFSLGVPINRQWGVKFAYLGGRTLASVGADTDTFATGVSVLW